MTIMSDRWITRMATEHGMIEPFEGRQVREGVISYGVSSYGYDMRVAREFRIFTNVLNSIVDPKNFQSSCFVEFDGDVCIVPPNSFALARSVEYFRIPRELEHYPASGEDLRQRGYRAGAVLRRARGAGGLVQGQEGQVPGAARGDSAPHLSGVSGRSRADRPALLR